MELIFARLSMADPSEVVSALVESLFVTSFLEVLFKSNFIQNMAKLTGGPNDPLRDLCQA